jgi:hypothetical protein
LINELLQRFLSTALFSSLSFQFDLPLPMSRTDRRLLPMEERHVREQFGRYIDSVPCNPFFSGSRHGMVVSMATERRRCAYARLERLDYREFNYCQS